MFFFYFILLILCLTGLISAPEDWDVKYNKVLLRGPGQPVAYEWPNNVFGKVQIVHTLLDLYRIMKPRDKVKEDMTPHLNLMSESYDLSNHIVCEQPVVDYRIKKIEKVIL